MIAINDFRDTTTNQAFQSVCPQGKLISLEKHLGHHAAVDYMYSQVSTPYIMHCEDDWEFGNYLDLDGAVGLLEQNSQISQVCFRNVSDFNFSDSDLSMVQHQQAGHFGYARLDKINPQWHGYTFNPHLISIDLWRQLNGFSAFKKERHISRTIRAKGRFTAYVEPGCCNHIGFDHSVSESAAKPTLFKTFKKFLRNKLT